MTPTVAERFFQETGHVLEQVTYPSSQIRNRNILKGEGKVDLIMFGSTDLHFMQKMGKLTNMSAVPFDNTKHIDPRWQKFCGEYGAAYSWGTTGIAYRSSIATRKIVSWKQFFQPEPAFRGRVVYSLDEVMPVSVALLALNASVTTPAEADVESAVKLLEVQSAHVLAYQNGMVYAELSGADSKMAMTLTYSSDVAGIRKYTQQKDWVYVVPSEGTTLWVDCLANPVLRPLSAAAQDFLDFINRPDIAALNAEQTQFSTPNSSALKLTSEGYRLIPHLTIKPEILDKSSNLLKLERETFTYWRNILRKVRESNIKEPGSEEAIEAN